MTEKELRALAKKHADGSATEAESERVEAFYDRLQERAEKPQWTKEEAQSTQARILGKVQSAIREPKHGNSYVGEVWRVAAAVVLVAGLGLMIYLKINEQPTVQELATTTTATQRSTIVLADGSTVRLNVGSTLYYPETFIDSIREVRLVGEAFFDVQPNPNQPFLVRSGELTTRVLGTTFNVRAYAGEQMDVTVTTGRVRVATAMSQLVLQPDEQAYLDEDRQLNKRMVDNGYYSGWREATIAFDLIPFDQAIAKLARWYHMDTNIVIKAKSPCLVRATYRNEGITDILTGLQNIVDFEYEFRDAAEDRLSINVTSRGCIN